MATIGSISPELGITLACINSLAYGFDIGAIKPKVVAWINYRRFIVLSLTYALPYLDD